MLTDPGELEPAHVAARPSWTCRACFEPWPCELARKQLVVQTGGGTALAMAAWTYLEEFARDQGPGPLGEAFDRFIRWTRQPPLL
jgi:hypothetical protein